MSYDRRTIKSSSSGFFFDVERWFGSVSAQRMSFAEKGVYLVMMFQEWRDRQRSLPDDAQAVADLIAVTESQVAEVLAAWPVVRRKFLTCDREPGRVFNAAVERTRRQQLKYKRTRSDAGKKGAQARASKAQKPQEISAQLSLSSAQAKPSDLNRGEESRPDLSRGEGQPTARSKRPIFAGQRLTVFEWMLDDCMKTLGTFTNDFDLHEWFGQLDADASRINLVIPRRDGGEWLQSQLLTECRKRGLPIATPTPTAGKLTSRMASALANIAKEGA